MTLDASVVGRRIVVRHEIGGVGPSGGPAMTDVVGRVVAVDAATVRIERRDGSLTDVPLTTIVTWKPVPDRPARRRRAADVDPDELTRITSRGWPAVESMPLGAWELRASGGFTGRANSVAVHGDPGLPLGDALEAVGSFYAERGLPTLAQVVEGSAWDAAFAQAGWRRSTGTRPGAVVQVADLEPGRVDDPEVRVAHRADDAWLVRYGRVDDPALARAVMEGPEHVAFVSIGDPTVAIGRVVVTGEWAGIAAVEVVSERRRQGLADRVVAASLAWAFEAGADKAYLQTMRDNTAALALYARWGFTDHHDYRYLAPPH